MCLTTCSVPLFLLAARARGIDLDGPRRAAALARGAVLARRAGHGRAESNQPGCRQRQQE